MNINSSQPTPEEIYYAAEQYLVVLSNDLQIQLRELLEQSRSGKKVDNAILLLISDDTDARKWMREALFGDDITNVNRVYEPMLGNSISISSKSVWVCPQCGFEWHVIRAGRPVPYCPKDYSVLVRKM